jgi:CRS1 / YhbY (CRM) domain
MQRWSHRSPSQRNSLPWQTQRHDSDSPPSPSPSPSPSHNEVNYNFNLPHSEDKPHPQLEVEFAEDTSYAAVAASSSPENQTTSHKQIEADSFPQQTSLPSKSAHQIQTSGGHGTVSGKPTTLKRFLLRGSASANITPILSDHPIAKPTVSLPWVREQKLTIDAHDQNQNKLRRKRSNTEMAQQMIPELELQRLRDAALRMKERMKVGSAGVTDDVVQAIHNKWNKDEVVKLRFEGPPSLHMTRTHQILEVHKFFCLLLLFIL